MSDNKKLKVAIRARQQRTGERYTTARMHVLASREHDDQHTTGGPQQPLLLIERIRQVLEAQPDLTYFGFRSERGSGVDKVSRTATPEEFERERGRLLEDDAVQQVVACLEYLDPIHKLRSAKPKDDQHIHGSYGMKHEVEAWQKSRGTPGYVANGSFIVAAILAGFRIHRVDPGSPNCLVGVNPEDVRATREGKDPREWRKMSEFVKWLLAQAERDDPVGDLAGDCKVDFSFPRRGDAAVVGAYLSRYGEHIREAFAQAVVEYRHEHGMVQLRLLTVAETAARLGISEPEVTEDWLEGGSFRGARQDVRGRWTIPELDVLIVKHEMKKLRERNRRRDYSLPDGDDEGEPPLL